MERDAVGEDAVQVGVRVHEARREGLAGRVDDFILRVRLPQLSVGRNSGDLIRLDAHAPAWLWRLAGEVDEVIRKDQRTCHWLPLVTCRLVDW